MRHSAAKSAPDATARATRYLEGETLLRLKPVKRFGSRLEQCAPAEGSPLFLVKDRLRDSPCGVDSDKASAIGELSEQGFRLDAKGPLDDDDVERSVIGGAGVEGALN